MIPVAQDRWFVDLAERAIVIVQWITDQDVCGSSDRLFQWFGHVRDLSVDDILVYSRSEAELVKLFRVALQTLRVGLSGLTRMKPYRIWWLSQPGCSRVICS